MPQDRAAIWAHLNTMYEREASQVSALVASASILFTVIGGALIGKPDEWPLQTFVALAVPLFYGIFLIIYLHSRTTGAYVRRLEAALRSDPAVEIPVPKTGIVRVPFLGALNAALFARQRSTKFPRIFRFAFGAITSTLALFVYGSSLYLAWQVEKYRFPTLSVVVALLAIEFVFYARASSSTHAQKLTLAADEVELERITSTDHRASFGWMAKKLLLPRGSGISKAIWIFWGGLMAFGLTGHQRPLTFRTIADLLVGIFVLEIVVIQGRYLINDMRDRMADKESHDPLVKSRIGKVNDTQLLILATSIFARLAIAFYLINLASSAQARNDIKLAVLLTVLLTVAYELARDRQEDAGLRLARADRSSPEADEHAEDAVSKVKLPTEAEVAVMKFRCEMVYLIAAAGYAVRVLLGARVVGGDRLNFSSLAWILLGVAATHYAMVLMGWVLAGMEGLRDSEQKSAEFFDGSVRRKPHYYRLMTSVGLLKKGARCQPTFGTDGVSPVADLTSARQMASLEQRSGPVIKALVSTAEPSNIKNDYGRWGHFPLTYLDVVRTHSSNFPGKKEWSERWTKAFDPLMSWPVGFRRRIYLPAAFGALTVFATLLILAPRTEQRVGIFIVGSGALWGARWRAWSDQAEANQLRQQENLEHLAILRKKGPGDVGGVFQTTTILSDNDKRRGSVWSTVTLRILAVAAPLALFTKVWMGWDWNPFTFDLFQVLRVNGLMSSVRSVLLGAASAVILISLTGDMRRTAATSLGELRLMPYNVLVAAWQKGLFVVASPVAWIFGKNWHTSTAGYESRLTEIKNAIDDSRKDHIPVQDIRKPVTFSHNLGTAEVDKHYETEFHASGGNQTFDWESGTLPEGLELDKQGPSKSVLWGVPKRSGSYKIEITVRDTGFVPRTRSKTLVLLIRPPANASEVVTTQTFEKPLRLPR